jgi:hypothetical protein
MQQPVHNRKWMDLPGLSRAIANGLPPPPVISYACSSGFYLGEPCGTCMPCIKGFHCIGSPSNKRLLCEAGTYADREQSLECKLCPPHSISRRGYRGAESILDCLCNGGFTLTVGTAMEEQTCQMCVDSYKDTIGPEACTACPSAPWVTRLSGLRRVQL